MYASGRPVPEDRTENLWIALKQDNTKKATIVYRQLGGANVGAETPPLPHQDWIRRIVIILGPMSYQTTKLLRSQLYTFYQHSRCTCKGSPLESEIASTMPALPDDLVAAITKSVSDGFDQQLAYTQELIHFGGQRGEETDVQNFIFQQFADRGYDPVKFDMDEQALSQHVGAGKFSPTHSRAPIVVGTHKPKAQRAEGKSLILNGHIDVVPLGPVDMWKDKPYSARVVGDKLYGRGAGDMRSGHAANLWALDALRRIGLQPASEVILQSVVEEESTGNGTLMTYLKGYKADAVLIPEPMQEQLVRANVGVLWFQIEVRGRPVHVRAMGTGVNAIDACWKVVGALRELEADWNERHVNALYFEKEKHPLSESHLPAVQTQWC